MWLFGLLSPKKTNSNSIEGATAADSPTSELKRVVSDKASDTVSVGSSEEEDEDVWRTTGSVKVVQEQEEIAPVSMSDLKGILGKANISVGPPPSLSSPSPSTPGNQSTKDMIDDADPVSMSALKSILGSKKISLGPPPAPIPQKSEQWEAVVTGSGKKNKKNGDSSKDAASVNALKTLLAVPIVPVGASLAATAAAKDVSTPAKNARQNENSNSSGKLSTASKSNKSQQQCQNNQLPQQKKQVASAYSNNSSYQGNGQGNGQSNGYAYAYGHQGPKTQAQNLNSVSKSRSNPSLTQPAATPAPTPGPAYYAGSSILNSPAPTALPLPTFDLDHSDFFDGFELPPPPAHQPTFSPSSALPGPPGPYGSYGSIRHTAGSSPGSNALKNALKIGGK